MVTELPPPLLSADYYQNPYPTLKWLRDNDPVHRFTFPMGGVPVWIVTRYDHVRELLSDRRFTAEPRWANPQFAAAGLAVGAGTPMERSLTAMDPPDHTRIRRLAMSAFTPRRIAEWRDLIGRVVAETLRQCGDASEIDALYGFAAPIPARVTGEIIGFSPDRRHDVNRALEATFTTDPERLAEIPQASMDLFGYGVELVEEKRKRPGNDLTSAFIAARDEQDRLDETELAVLVTLLMLAGSDTSKYLIANSLLALSAFPRQRPFMADESRATNAVEEFLRYDAPVTMGFWRFATEDIDFAGTTIPAGDAVLPCLAAANRDERRFADPDRLDLTRADVRHLGLGHGIHNCLGAALARLQAAVAVSAFVRAFPDYRVSVPFDQIRYRDAWVLRAPEAVPVTL